MIEFTMLYNGTEKSLADWGIDDLQRERANLAVRTVTFKAAGRNVDAATLFPYGATVEIWKDRNNDFTGGTRWFYGRVEPWDLIGSGSAEDQIGRLVGIEWYLQNKIYQMTFTDQKGNTYTTPRVVLNVGLNAQRNGWQWLTTGQQIISALQWAINQGAPLQIGNIAPWASPASDFVQGITCWEVIQKMWRIESDFVFWVDDSTTPYPTVHCLKASEAQLDPLLTEAEKAKLLLTPKNIDLNAGNWLSKVHIKPRPDWQKTYFRIFYDQITTINNQQYLSIIEDHWPDPLPNDTESLFRGVDLFFNLAGAKISQTYEEEIIASVPFDITSLASWQRWDKTLTAANIQSVVIMTAASNPTANANQPAPAIECLETDNAGDTIAYNAVCNCELSDGGYHDWMPFAGQRVRATAWAQITHKNGTVEYKQLSNEFTAVAINLAGVATKYWQKSQTIDSYAEPVPANLARVMYQAWQALAAEGTITGVEKELSGTIDFNNCLNFTTPLQPTWANLNAVIQSISESAKEGITHVQFGAPLHLTAAQLIDLLRVCRLRYPSLDLNFFFGGALSNGGGTVQHPRKGHARAPHSATQQDKKKVVSASPDPANETDPTKAGTITLDTTITNLPAGQQVPLIQLSPNDILNPTA